TVYESCFYPQTFIHPISPEALFELRVNLPTNADTSAGNAWTCQATINNPANATETTCVISGNTITFNLKNNGSVPTATMREYIDALEAADTENKFYVYHPEYTPEDIAGITEIGQTSIFGTPVAMAATNFSGGGNGSSDSAPSNWELGTAGVDHLHIRGDEDGNWNDWLVQLPTRSGT
ncbi:MAG: hypothetical protein HQM00_13510, partial [Magnetococcales bacterium]|nr:hypothetical protein [Magnetococcales bacterium]